MKFMIFLGVTIGGGVGQYLGHLIDHNQYYLGVWEIILGTIGSLAGIWLAYKASQYYDL